MTPAPDQFPASPAALGTSRGDLRGRDSAMKGGEISIKEPEEGEKVLELVTGAGGLAGSQQRLLKHFSSTRLSTGSLFHI